MIEGPFHYQFRLIIIGDSTVGKTTLVKVFTEGVFSETIDPTVGVDFFAKIIDIKDGIKIKLQLWDTAGQEKFRAITKSYYRSSVGALLLYDTTRRSSFEHLADWLFEARKHIEPQGAVFLMIGCKADKYNEKVITREEAQSFADFHNMKFFETSSKTGQNVDLAFKAIAEQIYDKLKAGVYKIDGIWEGIKKPPPVSTNLFLLSNTRNGSDLSSNRIRNSDSSGCC